ncbi:hypothetical protein LTR91_012096 [Friedmanniomyces endolithicus]|uniref:Major facilitator superfamily (MFS) profile domain-containing protein n=1 Tax=Friedmanniomyces endolithicus TaxID=329885 RepID=A0AAN6KGG0_9PEZI|nr:hypothetical protein LTS01_018825 [Friedmanniomyces endolithicus]KAK0980968.1 hypothetical protein LTR91_012096 [Friedmanniomyces endolithicus]
MASAKDPGSSANVGKPMECHVRAPYFRGLELPQTELKLRAALPPAVLIREAFRHLAIEDHKPDDYSRAQNPDRAERMTIGLIDRQGAPQLHSVSISPRRDLNMPFLSGLQGKALYRAASACCGAAFMLYGWDAGVLGGIQSTPQFREAIGNPTGAFIIPIIASVYNLAAGVMSLCVTLFGMQLGRKRTILLGDLFICIGAVLQASTYSVGQIIAGRIVCGFGIGCIASAVPTYMAEMSLEASERGPEVSYQLALLITGVALAYWVDLGFVQGLEQHPWLWRIPLAMQSCFAIFSATLLFFLPDTPRWYYARGRNAEGDSVLARLYALPVEHEHVQLVRAEVMASLQEENDTADKFNFWLLFWDNSELQFGRRLRTSFLILWAQQFLGINMLVYFSTQIFSNLGYDAHLSGVLAGVLNTVFAIASYPPIWLIERIGRRALMFWGAIACGVCMLVYVILTTLPADKATAGTNWAAVVFIILYEVVFAIGWLGTCWVYGPEIAPLKYRHIAGGLGAAGEWFST